MLFWLSGAVVALNACSPKNVRGRWSGFLTKQHAVQLDWKPGKALASYLPNGQIGGDEFLNTTGLAPQSMGGFGMRLTSV